MGGPSDEPVRVVAGRYRLLSRVGRGGMGTVWRAHDDLLDRTVAIKEVDLTHVAALERGAMRERTLREARTAARLSHPNAVTVFDVVEEGGQPWIVMSLVLADSLAEVIRDRGPLSPERAAEIGLALLSALEAAHRAGILHRDVKPSNVLIGDGGAVVLTDFGIATLEGDVSLTGTGVLFGAPAYIAPERARGQRPGPASDLWSLGATLYTAVEGRPPFDSDSPMATLTALVSQDVPPPHSAGPLTPALRALLERDPQQRVDAAGARLLLQQALTGHPTAATRAVPRDEASTRLLPAPPLPDSRGDPVPPAYPYQPAARLSRSSGVLLTLLGLALLALVVAAVLLAVRPKARTPVVARSPASHPSSPAGTTASPTVSPTAAPTQPSPTAVPATSGWPTLQQGDAGSRVRAAQYLLRHWGRPLAVNGRFTEAMAGQVRDFQLGRVLPGTGIIDPATWESLTDPVQRGDSNDAVLAAQTLLDAHGSRLDVDGVFGAATDRAVRAFQADHGLVADGVVGLRTWQRLADPAG